MSRTIKLRHHVIPSSRGGPNAEWNLYYFHPDMEMHVKLHRHLHTIFSNALPSEMIVIIAGQWTNKDGSLNRRFFPDRSKRVLAWNELFGENATPQQAIGFIEREFIPVEEKWQARPGKRKGRHERN